MAMLQPVTNPNADFGKDITDEQRQALAELLKQLAPQGAPNADSSQPIKSELQPAVSKSEDPVATLKGVVAKAAAQSVAKGQDAQIQQAMAEGVPATAVLGMVLDQMGMGKQTPQAPVAQTEQTGNQYSQMASDVLSRKPEQVKTGPLGVIADLLTFGQATRGVKQGAIDKNIDRQTAELANIAKAQTISGEEPLQKGKKEEIGLQLSKDMAIKSLELLKSQEAAGNLKPNDIFTKFEQASVPFITARDAHSRLMEAVKDPSAAGDLAMVFNYMKVLDPGSTVREAEAASVENARGIPESIRNLYNKVMTGKKLTVEQRADFLDRSKRLFAGMEKQQSKTTKEFEGLAERNGIDFKKVVRDTGIVEDKKADKPMFTEGQTATNPKTGQKLTYRGGIWQ